MSRRRQFLRTILRLYKQFLSYLEGIYRNFWIFEVISIIFENTWVKYGNDQDPIFNKRANEFSKSAHWATILLFFFFFSFFFISVRASREPSGLVYEYQAPSGLVYQALCPPDRCTKPIMYRTTWCYFFTNEVNTYSYKWYSI